jgi:TolB-like protein/Tfp pilus assembly protein PilF
LSSAEVQKPKTIRPYYANIFKKESSGRRVGNLFSELRRRNVFRVAGVYAVAGWIIAQVAVVLETSLGLSDGFDGIVVRLLLVGFPVALLLAWLFEMSRDGVKRTTSKSDQDIEISGSNRALDFAILGALAVVAVLVAGGLYYQNDRASKSVIEAEVDAAPEQVVAAINVNSIAILPFADLSPDGDQVYFADGISEEILNVLARVDGLKVASRTSAFQFRNTEDKSVPEIALELKVRYVVEGSVRKAGDQLRITAQLIDGETDAHLFSETYDRTLTVENIFELQDEISAAIVEELGKNMGLGPTNAVKFAAAAGTDNLRAYDAYLEGREMFLDRSNVDHIEMLAKLEQVVAFDPDFARGWNALAAAYSVQESWRNFDRDYRALTVEAANRALALEPDLATAHAAIGMVAHLPDGRPDKIKTIEELDTAIRIDPSESILRNWRGQHLAELGFFERAKSDLLTAIDLNPNDEIAQAWMMKILFFEGKSKKAIEYWPLEFRETPFIILFEAIAAAKRGDEDAVRAAGARLPDQLVEVEVLMDPNFDYDAGYLRMKAGFEEKGIPAGVADRPHLLWMYKQYDRLAGDAELTGNMAWWYTAHEDFLSSPQRYALFKEHGLEDYWLAKGFPPRCRALDVGGYECD